VSGALRVVEELMGILSRTLEYEGYRCARSVRDYILSFGEVTSKIILAQALESLGVKTLILNAVDLIETDGRYGDARISYEETKLNLSKVAVYAREVEAIPIIEGFIGRGPHGSVVTLGRGGSDYTAIAIASLLNIPEVVLVTDVPGIMSTDTSISPRARTIPVLSYEEAIEASLHGVKRINPKSFEPIALSLGRPRVRVTNWDSRGTLVGELESWKPGPKVVALSATESNLVVVIGANVASKTFVSKLLEVVSEDLIVELQAYRSRPLLAIKVTPGMSRAVAKLIHDELVVGELGEV